MIFPTLDLSNEDTAARRRWKYEAKRESVVVSFVSHRSTGTGDRDRAGDRVLGLSKCRHGQLWG